LGRSWTYNGHFDHRIGSLMERESRYLIRPIYPRETSSAFGERGVASSTI
jgi:hypothetical protein